MKPLVAGEVLAKEVSKVRRGVQAGRVSRYSGHDISCVRIASLIQPIALLAIILTGYLFKRAGKFKNRIRIWVENKVNFDKPVNVMVAAITIFQFNDQLI